MEIREHKIMKEITIMSTTQEMQKSLSVQP